MMFISDGELAFRRPRARDVLSKHCNILVKCGRNQQPQKDTIFLSRTRIKYLPPEQFFHTFQEARSFLEGWKREVILGGDLAPDQG
jgi:hypothetical protein